MALLLNLCTVNCIIRFVDNNAFVSICLALWERHPKTGAEALEDFKNTTEACSCQPTPEVYHQGTMSWTDTSESTEPTTY